MSPRTDQQREKHAAYMREYWADRPGAKSAANKKYRERHREELNAKDRERNKRRATQKAAMGKRYRERPEVKERIRQYLADYYQKHKEKYKESMKRRADFRRERSPEWTRRHLYGIGMKEYGEMFQAQGGVCAICKGTSKKRLSIDHDHVTGKVRGLLCNRCNMHLSPIEKDPAWAYKALAYLRKEHALVQPKVIDHQRHAESMRRYRARRRRERALADDCRWFRVGQIAEQYQKSPMTIWRWCKTGFILTLGYRLRRSAKGQIKIGIPLLPNHLSHNPSTCSLPN